MHRNMYVFFILELFLLCTHLGRELFFFCSHDTVVFFEAVPTVAASSGKKKTLSKKNLPCPSQLIKYIYGTLCNFVNL